MTVTPRQLIVMIPGLYWIELEYRVTILANKICSAVILAPTVLTGPLDNANLTGSKRRLIVSICIVHMLDELLWVDITTSARINNMKGEMARNQHHEMDNEFVRRSHRIPEAQHISAQKIYWRTHCILSTHCGKRRATRRENTWRAHAAIDKRYCVNKTRLHDFATLSHVICKCIRSWCTVPMRSNCACSVTTEY